METCAFPSSSIFYVMFPDISSSTNRFAAPRLKLYEQLLRVRPAQLCSPLKRFLRIRRLYARAATGHTFWLDPVSIFGLHILRDGLHEPQMTKLFQTVLRPNDCVIDVGGNEGYFSVLASTLVETGQVHCIEPQSRLQPILRENVRINRAHAVVVHRLALSNTTQGMELYLRPSTNTGASSLYRHWKLGWQHERVRAMTLDEFVQTNGLERVRLLKMDCEGAEPQVISGASAVLARQAIDYIALEYHSGISGVESCRRVHDALKATGYTLTKAQGQCIYHPPGNERLLASLGDLLLDAQWSE